MVWLASFFLSYQSLSKTTTASEDKYLLQEKKENKELSTATTFWLSQHFYHSIPLRVLSFLAQHQIHVVHSYFSLSFYVLFFFFSLSLKCFLFLSHPFFSVCILPLFILFPSHLAWDMSILTTSIHTHAHKHWRIWIHNLIQSHTQGRTACTLSLGALLCSLNINCISQR